LLLHTQVNDICSKVGEIMILSLLKARTLNTITTMRIME
jgi:hypothetical protein